MHPVLRMVSGPHVPVKGGGQALHPPRVPHDDGLPGEGVQAVSHRRGSLVMTSRHTVSSQCPLTLRRQLTLANSGYVR
jgi:hypothetical protein